MTKRTRAELKGAAELMFKLSYLHVCCRLGHKDDPRRDEWLTSIALARRAFYQLTGLVITDENDFTFEISVVMDELIERGAR